MSTIEENKYLIIKNNYLKRTKNSNFNFNMMKINLIIIYSLMKNYHF